MSTKGVVKGRGKGDLTLSERIVSRWVVVHCDAKHHEIGAWVMQNKRIIGTSCEAWLFYNLGGQTCLLYTCHNMEAIVNLLPPFQIRGVVRSPATRFPLSSYWESTPLDVQFKAFVSIYGFLS